MINMQEKEGTPAEKLMEVLIQKMESMDQVIQTQQSELKVMKKAMANPNGMLRKMGFISIKTPLSEDLVPDIFRGDNSDLRKSDGDELIIPQTNEEFHVMDWADIHTLAEQAKDEGSVSSTGLE